ncbi:12934_t:CDS:2, partial [Gigaspora rosea]
MTGWESNVHDRTVAPIAIYQFLFNSYFRRSLKSAFIVMEKALIYRHFSLSMDYYINLPCFHIQFSTGPDEPLNILINYVYDLQDLGIIASDNG